MKTARVNKCGLNLVTIKLPHCLTYTVLLIPNYSKTKCNYLEMKNKRIWTRYQSITLVFWKAFVLWKHI